MPSQGTAQWKGDLKNGSGTFVAGTDITGSYSFKSRFEDGDGANPEQLIGAAHAACFSMALSNALAEAGTPADSIDAKSVVQLRIVDGAPAITKIELSAVGKVPGVDDETFQAAAKDAKENCPVSKALASVPEMTFEATLTA